ncbi:hypothetical protein PSm6_48940 [Pseudomonas solani]|uniref:Uncharacterized protein n=1 Tax=Pseudomonas solani TaxID=2731552 RepID=A0ABM7LFW4_9PSED|nr:hypothetical protein PSm6_48940 [Pseudomonas solani]
MFGVQIDLRRDHIANKALVDRQHHRFADFSQFHQTGFDFAQFDAQATDFHLVVDAAGVFDHAVRAITGQVAGAVHTLAGHEGVGDKAFGGQCWAAVVTPGQAFAGQVQLTQYTHRHWLQIAVEDVATEVGDRLADGHTVFAFIAAGPVGDVDSRFGGAIEVVQTSLRQAGEHLLLRIHRQGFTAADDAFEAAATLYLRVEQEGLQHRGHEVQRAYPLLFDQRHQLGRVAMVARGGHDQASARHQRPKELPHRDIEAERRLLQHAVAGIQTIGLLHPAQAVGQCRVAVTGPLGLPVEPEV